MTARLPGHHVSRPRLVAAVEGARATLLVAGGGFGKSVLASEAASALGATLVVATVPRAGDDPAALVAALRRALAGAGLGAPAGALDGAEEPVEALATALQALEAPVAIVANEAQRLQGEAAAVLARLVREVPAPHRVIVAGRDLAPPLMALRDEPGVLTLGADALSLTPDESAALVAAVLGREPDLAELADARAAAGGWPAAMVVAASALARGERPRAGGLDALLAALLGERLAAARAAARLPLLDEPLTDACLGDGTWRALADAGLPLAPARDGWWDLPGPVREALGGEAAPDPAHAREAAPRYAERRAVPEALATLARAGLAGEAVGVLAHLRWQEVGALGLPEARAALSLASSDERAAQATALLAAARAADAATAIAERDALVAEGLAAADGDAPLARAFAAERALDLARDGEPDAADELAGDVLTGAAPAEIRTRARALAARGRAAAFRGDAASLARADDVLAESAALCALAGEREWQSWALQAQGYRALFDRGEVERGIERLQASIAVLPAPTRQRAGALSFLADALGLSGQVDEAEAALGEAAAIARALGDARARGYAAWSSARIASLRGNAAGCIERLREAESSPGEWFAHPTGSEFLAEAAEMLARLGLAPEAQAALARARAHARDLDLPEITWLATGAVESRFGDPALAEEAVVQWSEADWSVPRDAWRGLLFRAAAAQRAGDDERAALLAGRAFEAAALLGLPDLPSRIEPDLAERLAPLAAGAGSSAGRAAQERPPALAVRLLGGFGVTADGRPADPPPGHAASLVKICALRSTPLPADEAIETLWPEIAPDLGRSRLRNLLNRLRERCDVVARDGATLVLAAGVEVDATAFDELARRALAASSEERAGLARAALARWGGPLLPADPYASWAAEERERLARRRLDLLDLLADEAQERGDLDEAVRLLDEAIAAEPLDDARHARCAELLIALGRRGTARTLVERATEQRESLGLPASPRLTRLLGAVGRPSDARGAA